MKKFYSALMAVGLGVAAIVGGTTPAYATDLSAAGQRAVECTYSYTWQQSDEGVTGTVTAESPERGFSKATTCSNPLSTNLATYRFTTNEKFPQTNLSQQPGTVTAVGQTLTQTVALAACQQADWYAGFKIVPAVPSILTGGNEPAMLSATLRHNGTGGDTYRARDFSHCGDVPVQGLPSITVTPPTCAAPTNTLTVTVPEGLTVNGFSAGTYTAEDIASKSGLTDIYHEWTVPVVATKGYVYTGPSTLSFTLTAPPTKKDCSPQPADSVHVSQPVETVTCKTDDVLIETSTTTTPYVWNEQTKAWELDSAHAVTTVAETHREKTDDEKKDCAVVVTPPTSEPTPTGTPTAATPVNAPITAHSIPGDSLNRTAPTEAPGNLAFTGSNTARPLILAGVLVLLGVLVLAFRRFRTRKN